MSGGQTRAPAPAGTAGRRVLVVGAGIVGICSAAYLQRAGFQVTVVDRLAPGEGCSFGNAGNVSPGAVVPYSMPGTLLNVPRWLFDPLGPLSLPPAHLPKLLPWLLGWMAASRPSQVRRISKAMHALHQPVFEAYAPLLAAAGGSDLIVMTGQLYVSSKPGPLDSPLARELRQAAGIRAEDISGPQVREVEPTLAPHFQSGLLLPDNGTCLNPHRVVTVLAEQVARDGGAIRRGAVRGFRMEAGVPVAALTEDGEIAFDRLVLAAGAWSNALSRQLGLDVRLEAERGYHVTIADPGPMPRIPVTNRDSSFATAPMEMGLRLAGTAEYAGLDAPPNWRRARILLEHGRRMYPGLSTARVSEWMGCRPTLPDGLPIIDRSARHPNVVFAFGHSHFGLTAAPATGRIVADLAAGRTPQSIDIAPYRASRFAA
ncbi:FAD-dependent oxidoreductase [Xanthobacter sp. KR7-225]|uniref:NAD(P)/FAD-dependent oxidoreductase n=1 Tax=Xanthobacter sp. KR7-225 TaxID=3156613 RepID=UPI0032B3466D